MKQCILFLYLLLPFAMLAQSKSPIQNIIIVTTDGFRWQEVFQGIDSTIAEMPNFNQGEKETIYQHYGAATPQERRKKLLPFLWNTMAAQGQLYGNRLYNNKIDNANPYWFSYPGYSEIFCGYVDTLVNSNDYKPNPNTNVLEFLNKQPKYKGKVAAFGAWNAFDRILNEKRAGFPVINAEDACCGNEKDAAQELIQSMKLDAYKPFGEAEPLDVFAHYTALEYLKKHQPKILYISYGDTDEFAHAGRYLDYLDAAHRVDKWLGDLWNYIQSNPKYKDKTALFISVDHGRGDVQKAQWTSHGQGVLDSHEIWFGIMGPGIPALGEVKKAGQWYQRQYAQTFAELLGYQFTAEHPVAAGLKQTLMEKP